MLVAQVCPRYYPYIGGVETHVREISERLAKKRFKVEVLTTDPSGELPREDIISGVKIKRFKSWAPNENYHFSIGLRKYLMRYSNNYDVVHAHSFHDFPALYAAQAKGRSKLVFTPHYHGTGHTFFRSLLHIPYRFYGRKIFEKADKIICVSDFEKNLVLKNFRLNPGNIVVIPDGINSAEFAGLKKRSKDCRVILSVCRLEEYKGVQCLVKALANLDGETVLEIVGKGPYKESLIRLSSRLGVADRVKFHQDLPRIELLQKYADADLFALLSKHEAYGIVVAEALASRTPCIVANTSALKEFVDNESCFGIDCPIDIRKLAEMMNKITGRKVERAKLSDWNEVAKNVELAYNLAKT
jgi:glycosyltransferase involved in cell wall biosynthesis